MMTVDYSRLNVLIMALRQVGTKEAYDRAEDALRDYFKELFHARMFLPLTLNYRCFRCGADPHYGKCKVPDNPFIEWVDPLANGKEPVYSRARFSDIAAVRRRQEPRYKSDEQAVEDFMVVHWAYYVNDAAHRARGGGPAEQPEVKEAHTDEQKTMLAVLADMYELAYRDGQRGHYSPAARCNDAFAKIEQLPTKE